MTIVGPHIEIVGTIISGPLAQIVEQQPLATFGVKFTSPEWKSTDLWQLIAVKLDGIACWVPHGGVLDDDIDVKVYGGLGSGPYEPAVAFGSPHDLAFAFFTKLNLRRYDGFVPLVTMVMEPQVKLAPRYAG